MRASFQALSVLVMARFLGAEGYGYFVALLAVSGFFVPLASLGLGGIILRDGARDPNMLMTLVGKVLSIWWPVALGLSLVSCLVAGWFLPRAGVGVLVLLFLVVEIISNSLIELLSRCEQAQGHLRAYGLLLAGLPLARLFGLSIPVFMASDDVRLWLFAYAVLVVLYLLAVAFWFCRRYRPRLSSDREWSMVRTAFPFLVGAASFKLQAEFNKPLIAQMGFAQVGNFSAAQRVVDLACLPLSALQESLWPLFYSRQGKRTSLLLASGMVMALALLFGVSFVWVAPWLPRILGDGFVGASAILSLFALLPLLQVVRNLMNALIIAKDRQSCLTTVYFFSAIASVLLNVFLIPVRGIEGAIWSMYLVELGVLLLLSIYLLRGD